MGELEFSSQTDEPLGLYNSSATLFTARGLVPGKRGKDWKALLLVGPYPSADVWVTTPAEALPLR